MKTSKNKCSITPYDKMIRKLSHPILPDVICNSVAEQVNYSLESSIEINRIKKYLLERFKNEFNNSEKFRDASRRANGVKVIRVKLLKWCNYEYGYENLDDIINEYWAKIENINEKVAL